MKLENVKSDVVVGGDIERNSVGIDVDNLSFILSIISSNLYSNPIESFIREITSNAWDSHIEAGTKDPVVIGINNCPTDFNKVSVYIQDFGVGLSPERFDKIFKKAGSSTKRDSNDQIGGFGIGRFSSLAVADMVHIISNYNGTKYTYLMYKDGMEINIDLALEQPTTDPNGVVFTLDISKSDFSVLRDGIINQLRFFDNVFLQGNYQPSFNESFNTIKIKQFNTFAVSTKSPTNSRLSILLGKVAYPLDTTILLKYAQSAEEKEAIETLNKIDKRISIKFDIGELLITPNREQILYKEATVRTIIERCMEFFKELTETKKDLYKKGLTYKELFDETASEYYTLVIDANNTVNTSGLPYREPVTVGGTLYPDFHDVKNKVRNIFRTSLATPYYKVHYAMWQDRLERYKAQLDLMDFTYKAVSIPNKLSQIDRKYLRAHYKGLYLGFWDGVNISKLMVRQIIKPHKVNKDLAKEVVKECLAAWDKQKKFNSALIPQDFRDKNRVIRSNTDSRNYLVQKLEYNNAYFGGKYSFKKEGLAKVSGSYNFSPDAKDGERLSCVVAHYDDFMKNYTSAIRQLISRHVTVITGAKLTVQILEKHYPTVEQWIEKNKGVLVNTVKESKKHLRYSNHQFDFDRVRLVEREFNIKTGINLKEKDYLKKKYERFAFLSDKEMEFLGTKIEVEDLNKTLSHPNLLKIMDVVAIYPEGRGSIEARKIYSKSLVNYFKEAKLIDNNNKIVYS